MQRAGARKRKQEKEEKEKKIFACERKEEIIMWKWKTLGEIGIIIRRKNLTDARSLLTKLNQLNLLTDNSTFVCGGGGVFAALCRACIPDLSGRAARQRVGIQELARAIHLNFHRHCATKQAT